MTISADTVRVFFALWPDNDGRNALACWPSLLPCKGRAMKAATLHATLVFLGEVGVDRLEALQLVAEELVGRPFELCFDQARYWGHNHIVYAAPSNIPDELSHLVFELQENLIRHRFAFDRRVYKPHVTLLRNVSWTDEPLPAVVEPVCWKVEDFVLLQSGRGEVDYTVLARFPLSSL